MTVFAHRPFRILPSSLRPCPREGELLAGGINRHHCGRGTASNNLFCEGAITTADIEPSKALWKVEPGEESFACKTAPTAHHPFIHFSVSEKLSFGHVDRSPVFFQRVTHCRSETRLLGRCSGAAR